LADQLFENGFDSPARVILKQEDLWDFMDKSPETMNILALSGQHPNKIQFGVTYWITKTKNYIRCCKKICLLSIAAKKFPEKTFDEQLKWIKGIAETSASLPFLQIDTIDNEGSRRSALLWWQR
jgi:hypothetical protein